MGDQEGNTIRGEWYSPQLTIPSFWKAKMNAMKRLGTTPNGPRVEMGGPHEPFFGGDF